MTLQKDIFKASEGDAWLNRNQATLSSRDWSRDAVCIKASELIESGAGHRVLEIGCGDGSRLHYLVGKHSCEVCGIDPSAEAVGVAKSRGVRALQGTADSLPFEGGYFNVVVFGFCLYLCDDADMFKIAQEADRVLASPGWLLILDFESKAAIYRPYRHRAGIQSRKMDNKAMFLWHPAYTLASETMFHHETGKWTDDADQWVSLACLREMSRV